MTSARSQPAAIASMLLAAADIKLSHSVFALPFAVLAAFMAAAPSGSATEMSWGWDGFAGRLTLIVLCMVLARTAAMLANRVIDREIDRRNPRTTKRAIPSGQLPVRHALTMLAGSAVGFMIACAGFGVFFGNWWPALLSLPVLLWITAYGFFKRWTLWCHIYLGSSLALAPLAAAIAVDPESLGSQPALYLISAMVLCWVAGFDIIYALTDVAVDREQGLHSIPARLGEGTAMWISRLLHTIAASCLFAVIVVDDRLGAIFTIGACLVTLLLIYEHLTVARWGSTRIALAFFTLNGIISCVLGVVGIADILL